MPVPKQSFALPGTSEFVLQAIDRGVEMLVERRRRIQQQEAKAAKPDQRQLRQETDALAAITDPAEFAAAQAVFIQQYGEAEFQRQTGLALNRQARRSLAEAEG